MYKLATRDLSVNARPSARKQFANVDMKNATRLEVIGKLLTKSAPTESIRVTASLTFTFQHFPYLMNIPETRLQRSRENINFKLPPYQAGALYQMASHLAVEIYQLMIYRCRSFVRSVFWFYVFFTGILLPHIFPLPPPPTRKVSNMIRYEIDMKWSVAFYEWEGWQSI